MTKTLATFQGLFHHGAEREGPLWLNSLTLVSIFIKDIFQKKTHQNACAHNTIANRNMHGINVCNLLSAMELC